MGLFDGAIQQMEQMFDTNVKPMFDQLRGDLKGDKDSLDHLAAIEQAQTAQVAAMTAQMKALDAHLVMSNKLQAAELRRPR